MDLITNDQHAEAENGKLFFKYEIRLFMSLDYSYLRK